MNTYEFKGRDQYGREQQIHIVAPDEGDAMIEFRSCEDFADWSVKSINQIIATAIIETVDIVDDWT